jgi:hypothetical protein
LAAPFWNDPNPCPLFSDVNDKCFVWGPVQIPQVFPPSSLSFYTVKWHVRKHRTSRPSISRQRRQHDALLAFAAHLRLSHRPRIHQVSPPREMICWNLTAREDTSLSSPPFPSDIAAEVFVSHRLHFGRSRATNNGRGFSRPPPRIPAQCPSGTNGPKLLIPGIAVNSFSQCPAFKLQTPVCRCPLQRNAVKRSKIGRATVHTRTLFECHASARSRCTYRLFARD